MQLQFAKVKHHVDLFILPKLTAEFEVSSGTLAITAFMIFISFTEVSGLKGSNAAETYGA